MGCFGLTSTNVMGVSVGIGKLMMNPKRNLKLMRNIEKNLHRLFIPVISHPLIDVILES